MFGNLRGIRRLTGAAALAFMAAGLVRASATFALQTSRAPGPAVRLYNDSPAHLWNRLHASLFVRVAPDGREYGADRVDPLLWVGSTYLLQGPTHVRAVKLLNEFVDRHGEQLIRDPLRRAVLQRDLWAIFDWLEGAHIPYQQPQLTPQVLRRSADELCSLLATIIARLALTPAEIRTLPDNYAGAARANPLPPDLFAPDGPWVPIGRSDGPIAARHLSDEGPGRNSVFLVLIRLPDGRDATVRYLETLRSFSNLLYLLETHAGMEGPNLGRAGSCP
jgi:hypothetical protein